MAGIAGIAKGGQRLLVGKMLEKLAHRGRAGQEVLETENSTLGLVWNEAEAGLAAGLREVGIAADRSSNSRFAQAQMIGGKLTLIRDPLGVAPLYHGQTAGGELCFASEVKALLVATHDVREFPPGHQTDGGAPTPFFRLEEQEPLQDGPEEIAAELRRRLECAVEHRARNNSVGAWLSGGLDSTTMAALACRRVDHFHTFAAGMPFAPDLEHARAAADYIGSQHHEVIVGVQNLLDALPDVIYHLESFDALLVRSSLTNYLVARQAGDFVPAVFSGEGGDELFAGYAYIRNLALDKVPGELIDITGRLHNTALQRVDRSAAAGGTVAYVPFADPDIVDYALRIPPDLKLHEGIEKWILRQAMADALPDNVLNRRKSKFWEGAGIGEVLAQHAEETVSDEDFARERVLPNGWRIHTKEELMYYRIFREHFGEFASLDWMGRTKGAPVN